MNLKTHGRYRYSPISGRPHYKWTGGKHHHDASPKYLTLNGESKPPAR